MFKKYLTLMMAALIFNLSLGSSAFAETKDEKAAKLAQKVKANIIKLGTGPDARIEVKLKDGTKVKGYVSEINESSIVIVDENKSVPTEVQYSQLKKIKGKNLSTGDKVWIAAGIISVVFIVWFSLAFRAKSCPCP